MRKEKELDGAKIRLSTKEVIRYILAGKAKFTIINANEENLIHRYKVVRVKRQTKSFIVYASFGQKYLRIGTISDGVNFTPYVNLSFVVVQTSLFHGYWVYLLQGSVPEHIILRYSLDCARCGTPLVDPVSQERGFGPTCYKKSRQL
jgi:hypothetical protein